MPIKIDENGATINMWSGHALAINGLAVLPNKVLKVLNVDHENYNDTIHLDTVPVENVSSYIDYRFWRMRVALDEVQLRNKILTMFYCFIYAMLTWSALYYYKIEFMFTVVISAVTAMVMCSLFARRFIFISLQDKALHEFYLYFVKEHLYLYQRMYNDELNSKLQLITDMTNYSNSTRELLAKRDDLDISRDEYQSKLEASLDSHIAARRNLMSIYQDLVDRSGQEVLNAHITCCKQYGLEVINESDVSVHEVDTVQ